MEYPESNRIREEHVTYWRRMASDLYDQTCTLHKDLKSAHLVINSYRLLAVIGWAGFVGALCLTL